MIVAGDFLRDSRISHSPRLIRNPDVSVILPTYCRGDSGLLARAIDSVLAQSFTSFELLVMDDGSIDSTSDLVSAYVKRDDRVIHVRHGKNCGLPALRVNEGLLMARGTYCAYQFDDDQWTNDLLVTLLGALRQAPDFDVAYGLCEFTSYGGQGSFGDTFDYARLVTGNYIANNSVVHRRSVFEQFGGYDMHVVMRRLCDWDLWLRWGRRVGFLFVNQVVSMVEGGRAESIGSTCPLDFLAIRAHMACDRDDRLRPESLKSYALDDLGHLSHLGHHKISELWQQQIAPYQSRSGRACIEHRSATRRRHILVTGSLYEASVEVAIGNFGEPLSSKFAFTFVPPAQIDEAAILCADILMLHGAPGRYAMRLAGTARKHGRRVVLLMDEDLTALHEVAEEFAYLAPGTPERLALDSLIQDADLVITYSRLTEESVRDLNPRTVMLRPSILRKWLDRAKLKVQQVGRTEGVANPARIGYAAGPSTRDELDALWPAIVHASRDLGERAEFHFWGLVPKQLDKLSSPCRVEPFISCYERYMDCLTRAGFDVMLAPLFSDKRAKRAKCPSRFLEITAAGAVGIYSDVEPYAEVTHGISGIKCKNDVASWRTAILEAAFFDNIGRNRMVSRAVETIDRDYTSEAQAHHLAAALEAAALQRMAP